MKYSRQESRPRIDSRIAHPIYPPHLNQLTLDALTLKLSFLRLIRSTANGIVCAHHSTRTPPSTMEHNHVFLDYENIMRNYPCTVMTKAWRPQFPGPPVASSKEYSKLLIPDKIRDIVINSPRLRTLLDTVSSFVIFMSSQ